MFSLEKKQQPIMSDERERCLVISWLHNIITISHAQIQLWYSLFFLVFVFLYHVHRVILPDIIDILNFFLFNREYNCWFSCHLNGKFFSISPADNTLAYNSVLLMVLCPLFLWSLKITTFHILLWACNFPLISWNGILL